MRSLLEEYPALAGQFLWRANRLPAALPDPLWLQFGCGENVLEGFLNLDFLPHDGRVSEWDLLEPWPRQWPRPVRGAFSEDTLEHFFLAEQLYILCEVNRLLVDGGVFRVLMPALDRLIAYCRDFAPRRGEFLHETFGVETEADAINAGMRFSGHRWLHDDRSLARLAAMAGFEAIKTSCEHSTQPHLSRRNLRVEEGTAAFAHDLRRTRALERVELQPSSLQGLERLEDVRDGIGLYRIREPGAWIDFTLPRGIEAGRIACINVRSGNLDATREHSLKRIVLRGPWGEGAWPLDESLKSRPCINLMTSAQACLAAGDGARTVSHIALQAGAAGERITAGLLELFVFPDG